ncbi:MAG: hypothetical protein FWE53_01385 [Firmicutes bacterium]|nr:hypothetical protein [Bacillota bacterium]
MTKIQFNKALNIALIALLPLFVLAFVLSETLAYYSDNGVTHGKLVAGSIGAPVANIQNVEGLIYPGNTNMVELTIKNPAGEKNTPVWVAVQLVRVYTTNRSLTAGVNTMDITGRFTIAQTADTTASWLKAAAGMTYIYRGTVGAVSGSPGVLRQGNTTSTLKFNLTALPGYSDIGQKGTGTNQWASIHTLLGNGQVKVEFRVEFLQAANNTARAGSTGTLFQAFNGVNIFA